MDGFDQRRERIWLTFQRITMRYERSDGCPWGSALAPEKTELPDTKMGEKGI